MVGPSGAGKSTWLHGEDAREMGIKSRFIVSSDEIREDLCGDFRSQDRNDEVFAALHAVVKTRIRHGLETVVDATNLRRKDRMAVAALAPADSPVHYVVIDRPMEDKRRNAGWRAEIVGKDGAPFDLIAKHDQMFRSQLKDILAGDGLPNVVVVDMREE
jgi:predicted kinase